jgi:hypothetical protein
MKLRKKVDGSYTLKEVDENGEESKEAHYKFVRIRDVSELKKN